jgi:hypothetical protein
MAGFSHMDNGVHFNACKPDVFRQTFQIGSMTLFRNIVKLFQDAAK